jgi:prophage DNA circulation protein
MKATQFREEKYGDDLFELWEIDEFAEAYAKQEIEALQNKVEKMEEALEEIKSGSFDSITMMSIAHNALNQ